MGFKFFMSVLFFCVCQQSYAQTSTNGDEKINCNTTTVSTPYYYGQASCFTDGRWLSSYINSNTSQTIMLTERHWNGSYYETYQCNATLPHIGYTERTVENCQYTPRATIRKHYIEESYDSTTDTIYYQAGIAVAAFEFSDRDGHITQVEKWVNGVSVNEHHIDVYESTHVRLRVTDNHGYVTETSTTIYPPSMRQCMRGGMLIICDEQW